MSNRVKLAAIAVFLVGPVVSPMDAWTAPPYSVSEDDEMIAIDTPQLRAVIRKKGYVSGVAGGTLLDKKTGFVDAGHGLDIVDWIMEAGTDEAYRDQLEPDLVYQFNNPYHGKIAKRSIEGPQICTQARQLDPRVIRGKDFVGIEQSFTYRTAAPGKKTGSQWTQYLVFPIGQRYFVSMDRIDSQNSSDAMFLRVDMPGHVKHKAGDTFSEIYLSYLGGSAGTRLASSTFFEDFAPDERNLYGRGRSPLPQRFIRAYRLRDEKHSGPWLAGMTLDPSVVHEAWCHQRGYVCMIQEFGGRPIKAGESFSAAFIVGYFDSIDEMHEVYDRYRGNTKLAVDDTGWRLSK